VRFSREFADSTGLHVIPTSTVGAATAGADIVATASSSPGPIFTRTQISPGAHVTLTRPSEAPRDLFDIADVLVTPGGGDPVTFAQAGTGELWRQRKTLQPANRALVVTLGSIVVGSRAGRTGAEQITVYGAFAGYSPAICYAALGAELLNRSRLHGVGKPLASEILLQGEVS